VRNLLDTVYYHPGLRTGANPYAPLLPQNDRSAMLRILFEY
jgi:hypothetical protein